MIPGTSGKTPVMVLHEQMTRWNKEVVYNSLPCVKDDSGNILFVFEVKADDETAVGKAKSKKLAKQDAASLVLEKIYHKRKHVTDVTDSCNNNQVSIPFEEYYTTNLVGELQQFCVANKLKLPHYKWTNEEGPPHCKTFGCICTVAEFSEQGTGRTKQDSKHSASEKVLLKLKSLYSNYQPSLLCSQTPKAKMDEINADVIKKLHETKLKKVPLPKEGGYRISDYFRIICSDAFPKSATLEKIKDQKDNRSEVLSNADKTLKSVLKEMDFAESHGPFLPDVEKGTHSVWLTIESSPSWSFFGYGNSEETAYLEACCDALEFFVKMSS